MYYYTILCRGVGANNATVRDRSRFHSRYAAARDSISFPLVAPFHYASNACIYTLYSPASRVYHYCPISPETKYLQVFVREYETFAPSSIKAAGPDADA